MKYDKYILVMLPYPSGNGLHIGHFYNYALIDSYAKWQRFKGFTVFQPFGYDSFGLPAEMYAEKVGGDPREITYQNIDNFRKQMEHMNTDFEEKLITSDDSYIKWTQWLFTKLLEHGLAYKQMGLVNWDPVLKTTLANEQVIDGISERSGAKVEMREMEQWYFKLTAYKDRLIKNLEWLDFPESTKKQQRNWLENPTVENPDWCVSRQRKWGCPIPLEGETDTLDTFVDSSFYWLRYINPEASEIVNKDEYHQPDLYVGGPEHACMHLIYARFINMFLYDIGYVSEEEPFKRLIHQGMITKDGAKMSKSKGNVVNPMEYDSDELRLFLAFIGPYFDGGDWNDKGIKGIRKFLGRMERWIGNASDDGQDIDLTQLITTIDDYTERFKFNKVVSSMMEFYNKNKSVVLSLNAAEQLTNILKCWAPGFKVN